MRHQGRIYVTLQLKEKKREGKASRGDREGREGERERDRETTSPGFHIRPVSIAVWWRETHREKFWKPPLACCPGTQYSHLGLVTYTI